MSSVDNENENTALDHLFQNNRDWAASMLTRDGGRLRAPLSTRKKR